LATNDAPQILPTSTANACRQIDELCIQNTVVPIMMHAAPRAAYNEKIIAYNGVIAGDGVELRRAAVRPYSALVSLRITATAPTGFT